MTFAQSYKELIVWQKSMALALQIFSLTNDFPKSELYGLTSQMRRCAVSIPSNIAEGFGRNTTKEFVQFLAIAFGSVLELETQLELSKQLKFAPEKSYLLIEQLLSEVSKMIKVLQSKLRQKTKLTY